MGLIYKLGNTIQGLPFPGNVAFSTIPSILVSLLVSIALSGVQWQACWITHSVSLAVLVKVRKLQIPFFSIILFSFLYLATLLLVWSFNWERLDAIIGLLEAATLFLWGGVISVDAYWQMIELDKNTHPD